MATEKNLQGLSGKRRKIASEEAILYPLFWRTSHYGRHQQFKEWRNIAMQVADRSGIVSAFRLLAAFDEVFLLERCDIIATDLRISEAAGHCATKTVQRGIADLKALGLVVTSVEWIPNEVGKRVRGRRMQLSVPSDLQGIVIPEFE